MAALADAFLRKNAGARCAGVAAQSSFFLLHLFMSLSKIASARECSEAAVSSQPGEPEKFRQMGWNCFRGR